MKQFFSMGRGEASTLVFLIIFSVFSFLPVWREIEIGGMAVFGWLMVALMIISPALALFVFRRADRSEAHRSGQTTTGRPGDSEADTDAEA